MFYRGLCGNLQLTNLQVFNVACINFPSPLFLQNGLRVVFQKLTAVRNSSDSNEPWLWINNVMLCRASAKLRICERMREGWSSTLLLSTPHSRLRTERSHRCQKRLLHSSFSFSFSEPNPLCSHLFFL